MKEPKISVVMSVYNGEEYLNEAIDSILKQTFKDFEFIIINDGSVDRTHSIINSYNDSRIVYINQDNQGLSAALNNGISVAKGKYIARMDDDDISNKERFQIQYSFMEENLEYVAIGTQATYITELGEDIYSNRINYSSEELSIRLPNNSPFVHSSVMMRTNDLKSVGGYKDTGRYFYQEDLLLWIDLSKKGKFYNIDKPLVKFRITKSSNQQRSVSYFKYQMSIVDEYWKTGKLDLNGINSINRDWGKEDDLSKSYRYNLKIGLLFIKNGNNNKAKYYLKKAKEYSGKSRKVILFYFLSQLPINYTKIIRYIKKQSV